MSDEGQVRACAPYSYLNWCDEAASVVRQHIKQQGYRAVELATRRPSIREGRLKEFMQGKGAHSGRSIAIYAEAAGLGLERPKFRKRTSWAPRVRPDTPREDWG